MEYVISNPNNKIFIRLNENGTPEACCKSMKQTFSEVKAKNILKSMPKTLKKFHFIIKPYNTDVCNDESNEINENIKNEDNKKDTKKCNVLESNRVVKESSLKWIERAKSCKTLFEDAINRREELIPILKDIEKEKIDILHIIELTNWKNVCNAYNDYRRLKNLLEQRREIKDELRIVTSIITSKDIDEVVEEMNSRVYTFRHQEDL